MSELRGFLFGAQLKVAVLVDAAFFLTRYRAIVPNGRTHTGADVAEALHKWACMHMRFDGSGAKSQSEADLYRIFVYDCPPFHGKLMNPVSKQQIDFGKTEMALFRIAFQQRLPQLRKVALRLGHLSDVRNWTVKPAAMQEIVKGKRSLGSIGSDDVMLDVKQKGVDMRIGVDVASLAYKRLVDRIVLVAGDADFVPAAKLARREGIDVVLDSLHAHINASLYEHIDGLFSMAPGPANSSAQGQPTKGYAAGFEVQYRMTSPLVTRSARTVASNPSPAAAPSVIPVVATPSAIAFTLDPFQYQSPTWRSSDAFVEFLLTEIGHSALRRMTSDDEAIHAIDAVLDQLRGGTSHSGYTQGGFQFGDAVKAGALDENLKCTPKTASVLRTRSRRIGGSW